MSNKPIGESSKSGAGVATEDLEARLRQLHS